MKWAYESIINIITLYKNDYIGKYISIEKLQIQNHIIKHCLYRMIGGVLMKMILSHFIKYMVIIILKCCSPEFEKRLTISEKSGAKKAQRRMILLKILL